MCGVCRYDYWLFGQRSRLLMFWNNLPKKFFLWSSFNHFGISFPASTLFTLYVPGLLFNRS